MAKAAAERLFLSRRILKCVTKIKSNNIGIDAHASLHEQIGWVISLIYHHSCEHKGYVTKYVNKDSSTNFLLIFVAVCERKYFAKVSVTIGLCQRKIAH